MTNSKSTKRALLTSSISLILCFAMLLGTTFAWFTDSASTGVNKIQSGNLDINVYYATSADVVDGKIPDDSWEEVKKDTQVFNPDALWEPGYTEVVYFKIENAGSLALKYIMSANVVNEIAGINKAGAEFKLSDYLYAYYMTEDKPTVLDTRADAQSVDGFASWMPSLAPVTLAEAVSMETGKAKALSYEYALESGEVAYTTMAIFMPTTVGDEANYRLDEDGNGAPSIDLGINFVATQYTSEADSYGKYYDENAEYPAIINYDYRVETSEELKKAFAKGGNILLTGDIDLAETLNVEKGAEVYLDMNGKTITVDDSNIPYALYSKMGSKLTIDGNGTFDLGKSGMALIIPCGDVTIESGNFVRNMDGLDINAKNVYPLISGTKYADGLGQTVINGGYFDGGYYDANADLSKFEETTADITNRGKAADENATRVAIKNNILATLNLSAINVKVYGGTFVGMNPAWGDEGCMLPTTPDYLRPWSYYQGAFLDGQQFNENGIVLPEGYSITEGQTEDGRPTYTVNYSK